MSNSSTSSLPNPAKVVKTVVKSGKKLVEKVIESITCSDSESSVMTPIFTHNSSISEIKGGSYISSFYQKTLDLLNHKKTKWIIIITILIVILFFYFKSQNKSSKKIANKSDTLNTDEFEIMKDQNNKPILVKKQQNNNNLTEQLDSMSMSPHEQLKQQMYQPSQPQQQHYEQQQPLQQPLQQQYQQPQQNPIKNMTAQQIAQQMAPVSQQYRQNPIQNMPQNMVQNNLYEGMIEGLQDTYAVQPKKQLHGNKQNSFVQSKIMTVEPDSTDDELSQEDVNIMNHNLTAEEMESINRQLDQGSK